MAHFNLMNDSYVDETTYEKYLAVGIAGLDMHELVWLLPNDHLIYMDVWDSNESSRTLRSLTKEEMQNILWEYLVEGKRRASDPNTSLEELEKLIYLVKGHPSKRIFAPIVFKNLNYPIQNVIEILEEFLGDDSATWFNSQLVCSIAYAIVDRGDASSNDLLKVIQFWLKQTALYGERYNHGLNLFQLGQAEAAYFDKAETDETIDDFLRSRNANLIKLIAHPKAIDSVTREILELKLDNLRIVTPSVEDVLDAIATSEKTQQKTLEKLLKIKSSRVRRSVAQHRKVYRVHEDYRKQLWEDSDPVVREAVRNHKKFWLPKDKAA